MTADIHPDAADDTGSTLVGRAVAIHPDREEGLLATVRIAKTRLGDDTLELADVGALDASAGFLPMRGGEQWEERGRRRRVTRAFLGHIALVPEPAYTGAQVLAVRAQPDAPTGRTPNLDVVRAWRLEDRVASDPALNR